MYRKGNKLLTLLKSKGKKMGMHGRKMHKKKMQNQNYMNQRQVAGNLIWIILHQSHHDGKGDEKIWICQE